MGSFYVGWQPLRAWPTQASNYRCPLVRACNFTVHSIDFPITLVELLIWRFSLTTSAFEWVPFTLVNNHWEHLSTYEACNLTVHSNAGLPFHVNWAFNMTALIGAIKWFLFFCYRLFIQKKKKHISIKYQKRSAFFLLLFIIAVINCSPEETPVVVPLS